MPRARCDGCYEMLRDWEGYRSEKGKSTLCQKCYDIEEHGKKPDKGGFAKRR